MSEPQFVIWHYAQLIFYTPFNFKNVISCFKQRSCALQSSFSEVILNFLSIYLMLCPSIKYYEAFLLIDLKVCIDIIRGLLPQPLLLSRSRLSKLFGKCFLKLKNQSQRTKGKHSWYAKERTKRSPTILTNVITCKLFC